MVFGVYLYMTIFRPFLSRERKPFLLNKNDVLKDQSGDVCEFIIYSRNGSTSSVPEGFEMAWIALSRVDKLRSRVGIFPHSWALKQTFLEVINYARVMNCFS
ncbi:hypothetical protein CDAR_312981 [Caerostris darwini]|uniref:Uncharacterized protein n=1 Tax=Caerostris darwini TaxID=1538125 RepID=A0AAV4S2F7_9ARAC|nr:hypothetical protein CDAR_312981 [Caerostris darwini]